MSVLRLLLLGACVAAGWLALSLVVSAPTATASTVASVWGTGDDNDHHDAGLLGTVSTLSIAVDSTAETLLEGVQETTANLTSTVQPTVSASMATVSTLLETVTDTVDDAAGATTELIEAVIPEVVLPEAVIPEAQLPSEATDLVDGLAGLPTPASDGPSLGDPALTSAQQLTAALWPLKDAPTPWSPRDLILISSGALTAGGAHSGAAAACDLPFVERWLTDSRGPSAVTHDDRTPASPTFDTDCTPD